MPSVLPGGTRLEARQRLETPVRSFDHHVAGDPFEAFERHRDVPIFYSSAHGGFWVPTRFADIRAVLRDTGTFSSAQSAIPAVEWPRPLIPVELDAPDHTRYRALLHRFLSGPAGAAITARVGAACAGLATSLAPTGRCDVPADYSGPIQSALFAALFDLPAADLDQCARWAAGLSSAVPERVRRLALRDIREYLHGQVGSGVGLVGALERAALSPTEIVDIAFVMVLASVFTLTNSIGFAFRHLAGDPAVRQRIAESPSVCADVVEELLRMYSVTNSVRVCVRDTTLAGVRIAAGDRVLLCLSLADRDPEVFESPGCVRTDRRAPGHLAYGAGPHRCLGARIASQAITAALVEWHARIPEYSLAEDAVITAGGGAVCSLDTVPLRWQVG